MTPENIAVARQSLMLRSLPARDVDLLLEQAAHYAAPAGKLLFSQGDPADAVWIVVSGWVKLYRLSPSGQEAVVAVFAKGHSFGEAVALQGGAYPVFAEAVTDAELIRIDGGKMRSLLQTRPELAISILTSTFSVMHQLVAQIEQLKAQTGPQRVAEFLLTLTEAPVGPCTVQLPYDKVLIAGHLGMKPESLSRAFAKLRETGVHVTQDSANIEDIESLRAYAERDRAEAWHK